MIFNILFQSLPGITLTALAFLPGLYAAIAFNGRQKRNYAYLPVSKRTSFPYTIF
jgi:hypothetical protein